MVWVWPNKLPQTCACFAGREADYCVTNAELRSCIQDERQQPAGCFNEAVLIKVPI